MVPFLHSASFGCPDIISMLMMVMLVLLMVLMTMMTMMVVMMMMMMMMMMIMMMMMMIMLMMMLALLIIRASIIMMMLSPPSRPHLRLVRFRASCSWSKIPKVKNNLESGLGKGPSCTGRARGRSRRARQHEERRGDARHLSFPWGGWWTWGGALTAPPG
jgi:hypothetical protein